MQQSQLIPVFMSHQTRQQMTTSKRSILALITAAFCHAAPAAEKPNILFIAIDDLRPELGCYGSTLAITPHIDRLAESAMLFERAYCQVPVCGASRASLFTGMLPTPDRFVSFSAKAEEDAPDAKTLPQVFREAGYTTLTIGKVFHHRDDTQDRSWSEPYWSPGNHMHSHDPETTRRLSETRQRGRIYEAPDVADDEYPDGQFAQRTIQDLRRLKEAGKPFFLACGFIRPHLPFYAPQKYWDLYERDQIPLADNRHRPKNAPQALRGGTEYRTYHLGDYEDQSDAFHRMMRHGYLASTSYVDRLTGDILAELERLDLADNTIVVLWGDHGFHLGEHNFWGKHNTMHLSTRVPLIIRVPGKETGTTAAIVESSDIFPTLCALAGLDVPETVQGRSFAKLFDRPEQPFREAAYSRFMAADNVITERFSYTQYHGGRSHMLYDLEKDPSENENVADKPEYAEVVEQMKILLQQRMDEALGNDNGE